MAAPQAVPRRMTPEEAEEYAQVSHAEVVNGELVEKGVSYECGLVAARVIRLLGDFVDPRRLGAASTADTGLQIFQHLADDPDRVRRPDGLYFAIDNQPPKADRRGYCHTTPNLVIEVISPDDKGEEIEGKILDYIGAGIPMIWVFYVRWKRAYVYQRDGSVAALSENDTLTAEPVIPGFSVPVRDCFPDLLDLP